MTDHAMERPEPTRTVNVYLSEWDYIWEEKRRNESLADVVRRIVATARGCGK